MKPLSRYAAVACAVVLGACAGSTTEANLSTPLLNADVATMAADAGSEDVEIMREPVNFTLLAPSLAPGDMNPSNCPWSATFQRLVCASVQRNGSLTVTRSYAFFDANNAVQQAYDPLLTARANIVTDVSGNWSGEHWSAEIARHRELNVTGLAGTETQRTWNGTGTSAASRSRHSDEGAERSYEIACNLTIANVVVPVPNGSDRFPISGTITRQCTITFDGGPRDGQTVQRTAVMTFDGTDTATLTVGDKSFEVNLRNRHRGPAKP